MTTPLAAKIAREYGTPCAVIDMDRVERNIARIQAACVRHKDMRPGMVLNLRALLQRAALTEQEARTFHGVIKFLSKGKHEE